MSCLAYTKSVLVSLVLLNVTFSALMMLVRHQKGIRPVKNLIDGCWHGYLARARCTWFACGSADAFVSPSSLASLKSRMVLPFWCQLTQVVLEKRPLNGCSSSSSKCCNTMELVRILLSVYLHIWSEWTISCDVYLSITEHWSYCMLAVMVQKLSVKMAELLPCHTTAGSCEI